ncbi:MAG: VOC family protein [Planctomycetota bacterium]|jgi:predicted enzyme related to lactoylglutathione lyase
MTTNTHNDYGRFVWYDLMTNDVDNAKGFYSELFGWTVNEMPLGDYTYNMFMVGDTGVGGAVPLEQQEIPPHWIAYVSVADVAATTAKAEKLGGQVCVQPTSISDEVGEFSVITDPQGAAISTFKHAQQKPPVSPGDLKPGMACWTELWTADPAAASEFYGQLFGWNASGEDFGPEIGTYYLQKIGDSDHAGIMKTMGEGTPPYWCPYFIANNVDEDLERAAGLGANVILPGKDIPNVGRFGIISDPQGAVLALFAGRGGPC